MEFAGDSSPQTPAMGFPAAFCRTPPRPAAARKALRAGSLFAGMKAGVFTVVLLRRRVRGNARGQWEGRSSKKKSSSIRFKYKRLLDASTDVASDHEQS